MSSHPADLATHPAAPADDVPSDVEALVDIARVLADPADPARARLVAHAASSGDAVRQALVEALLAVLDRPTTPPAASTGAEVDVLTGLSDRGALVRRMDDLSTPSRASAGVAVIAVDVDGMARVNATYGREVGDEVLVRVSAAIRSVVRNDDLVARWADDEFLVVLQTADREAAGRRCREITAHVRAEPWDALASGLDVTVSAGLASGTVGELREVREHAATALEQARSRGGNRIVF